MKTIKYIFFTFLILMLVGFLHYFLPSRDIVQIVGTDVKRMDIDRKAWFWDKPDAGTQENYTRDVRFINATWPDGGSRVYRNEDTNWSFPPYFKFDSGDLNAEAQNLAKQDETWVAVSHYGWRIKLFSIFPNAYSIKRVAGPDTLLVPWFNIAFLSVLAFCLFSIYRFFARFKRKHVDPVTKTLGDHAGSAQDEITEKLSAFTKFKRRWLGSSK